jgi:ferredoxin-NADP reductase
VLVPVAAGLRHRLRVADVVQEAPGVVSLRIEGRRLDRLSARAGQFFIWRFLTGGRWLSAHPFSLSEAPDGRSLRITVKALGDHTAELGEVPLGTRVVAEGPFGVFTADARRREKALLIAGGIGITPIRALMEEMHGDVIVLYRAVAESDLVFRDELDALAAERGIVLRYLVGDHATDEGARLLTAPHLEELVPDLEERDVFVCGPPAMTDTAVRNLRAAGVRRRHIHAERFAL